MQVQNIRDSNMDPRDLTPKTPKKGTRDSEICSPSQIELSAHHFEGRKDALIMCLGFGS